MHNISPYNASPIKDLNVFFLFYFKSCWRKYHQCLIMQIQNHKKLGGKHELQYMQNLIGYLMFYFLQR